MGGLGSSEGVSETLVYAKLDGLLRRMRAAGRPDELVIVSGGARGVDTYAENWASRNSVPTEIFRADWARYGRSAGPRRDHEIVTAADIVVAFTTGSKETAHTIGLAEKAGKPLNVYFVNSGKLPDDEGSEEIDFLHEAGRKAV